jgi:hypothetical protein
MNPTFPILIIQSWLSSMRLLVTTSCRTTSFMRGHNCLLANKWTTRPSTRLRRRLHGQFNCVKSKHIANLTTHPRLHVLLYLANPHRYMYKHTHLQSPSLRFEFFSPGASTAMLTDLTEASSLIRNETNVKTQFLINRIRIIGLRTTVFAFNTKVQGRYPISTRQRTTHDVFDNFRDPTRAGSSRVSTDFLRLTLFSH